MPPKNAPQQSVTLKGSNPFRIAPVLLPRPGVGRPLQGRESNVTLSGGIAPSYFMVPFAGEERADTLPWNPVSNMADSRPPAIECPD